MHRGQRRLTKATKPRSSKELSSHFERPVPLNLKMGVSRWSCCNVPTYGDGFRPSCEISNAQGDFSASPVDSFGYNGTG